MPNTSVPTGPTLAAKADADSPGLRHFVRAWRLGECSPVRMIAAAGLQSAAAALMGLLLVATRTLVELAKTPGNPESTLVILRIGGLLVGYELLLFAAALIDLKEGIRVIEALRSKIFCHLLRLPISTLQSRSVGEWMASCDQEVSVIRSGLVSLPRSVITIPVTLAIYMGVIVWQSPPLAAIIAAWSLVGILPAFLLRRRLLFLSQNTLRQLGGLSGWMAEALIHVKSIKALCAEDRWGQSLRQWVQAHVGIMRKSRMLALLGVHSSALLMTACFILIILVGRWMLDAGTLTLGAFAAVLAGVIMFIRELRKLAGVVGGLNDFRAAVGRYLHVLGLEPERLESPPVAGMRDPVECISFKNVSFHYGDPDCLLKNMSFDVKRGETLAIVGQSGAGKSTLVDLVLGFINPEEGHIEIDGKPLGHYALCDWRKRVGVVFQNPALFRDTLRGNLLLAAPETSDEEIWRHLTAVGLDETIRLRHGLENATVAELGGNWSEGEAQRLVILRVLLARPSVLILDEATSALDARSEQAVVALLQETKTERITLVITHRMGLAAHADRVLVIGSGGIEAIASPEQAYENCPLFRYMCLAQHVVPGNDAAQYARARH